MKKGLPLLLFALLSLNCKAGIFDSIFVFKNPEPDFGLDGFNTTLRGHNVNFSGIKLGVQWQEKYTAGLSYYSLASSLDETVPYGRENVRGRLRMGYVSIYTEYTFFENEKWEFNLGNKTGIGRIYNRYTEVSGLEHKIGTSYFPLLCPYISGSYKILYWLGIGGSLGMTLAPEKGVTAPWVDIGIEIYFLPIYHKIIRPKIKEELGK